METQQRQGYPHAQSQQEVSVNELHEPPPEKCKGVISKGVDGTVIAFTASQSSVQVRREQGGYPFVRQQPAGRFVVAVCDSCGMMRMA
jgi:hypothetical protein